MSKPKITVIDYGVGNLLSVQRGLEHCGAEVILTSDPEAVLAAERVVLPGVGAFANAMEALQERGLVPALQALAEKRTPLLGICLGMQMLLDESEEFGLTNGLGLIPGRVVPVPTTTTSGEEQKIPHIGWSGLVPAESRSDLKGHCLRTIVRVKPPISFTHSWPYRQIRNIALPTASMAATAYRPQLLVIALLAASSIRKRAGQSALKS